MRAANQATPKHGRFTNPPALDFRFRSALAPALVLPLVLLAAQAAHGQQRVIDRRNTPPAEAPAPSPRLEVKAHPVNPTDPIAIINDEAITRQQLADEVIARKGKEVLETMIARALLDQAIRKQKMTVTQAEIDAEVAAVARRTAGVSSEVWLRTLEKDRGVTPIQYKRDIIYPTIALRKLAEPRVKITKDDLQRAYESQFGDKLRCRMIMVNSLRAAQEVWAEVRKNPGGFEKIAEERSMDLATKSMGGLIAEPIVRHSYPLNVSEAAFRQLVDGDPNDKDESHKPKDGDITGPIQVSEASWIILRREAVIPAQGKDPNDPAISEQLMEIVRDVKLQEEMGKVFNEILTNSRIENMLTGQVKLAGQAMDPAADADEAVRRASAEGAGDAPAAPRTGAPAPPPSGISEDVIRESEELQRAVGGTGAPAPTPPSRKP